MLLYQHTSGHYLAVAPDYEFAACYGYSQCFAGRNVPDIICQAFIRESGGFVIDSPTPAQCEPEHAGPSRARTRGAGDTLVLQAA